MARINKLIEKMVTDKVDRVILTSGEPMQFFRAGRAQKGMVLSLAQMEAIIQEVTPSKFKSQLSRVGNFKFDYSLPESNTQISVNRTTKDLSENSKAAEIARWRVANPSDALSVDRAARQSYNANPNQGKVHVSASAMTADQFRDFAELSIVSDNPSELILIIANQEIWKRIKGENAARPSQILRITIELKVKEDFSQDMFADPWQVPEESKKVPPAYQNNNFQTGRSQAPQSQSIAQNSGVQQKVEKGRALNKNGSFQTAIKLLQEAYAINPGYDGLAFELGFAYNAAKRYDEAVEVLNIAIENDGNNYIYHRELGYSLLQTKQYNDAIVCYTFALDLCPLNLLAEHSEMGANLSVAYQRNGEFAEAKEWSNKAREWAPEGSVIRRQLENANSRTEEVSIPLIPELTKWNFDREVNGAPEMVLVAVYNDEQMLDPDIVGGIMLALTQGAFGSKIKYLHCNVTQGRAEYKLIDKCKIKAVPSFSIFGSGSGRVGLNFGV